MKKLITTCLIALLVVCALLFLSPGAKEPLSVTVVPLSRIEEHTLAQEAVLQQISTRDDIAAVYYFDGVKCHPSDKETLLRAEKKARAALSERYLSYKNFYESKPEIETIRLGNQEAILLPGSFRISSVYHNESTVALTVYSDDLSLSKDALDQALHDQTIVQADYLFPLQELSFSIETQKYGWLEFIPVGDEEFGMTAHRRERVYDAYSRYSSDSVTGYMLILISEELP